jgi:hypothetical protein
MLKGSLSYHVFIQKIFHILTFHNYIENPEHKIIKHELSINSIGSTLKQVCERATLKNFEIDLNENTFINIIEKNCYLCDKNNSEYHRNGIDRIDNLKGYIISNSYACCSSCNFMKNNYDLISFFQKLILIYENFKDNIKLKEILNNNDMTEIKHVKKNYNKKTKTEKIELKKIEYIYKDKNLKDFYNESQIIERSKLKLCYNKNKCNLEDKNNENIDDFENYENYDDYEDLEHCENLKNNDNNKIEDYKDFKNDNNENDVNYEDLKNNENIDKKEDIHDKYCEIISKIIQNIINIKIEKI